MGRQVGEVQSISQCRPIRQSMEEESNPCGVMKDDMPCSDKMEIARFS